jgi:hypothetical protein
MDAALTAAAVIDAKRSTSGTPPTLPLLRNGPLSPASVQERGSLNRRRPALIG